jgi:hypothetical protein
LGFHSSLRGTRHGADSGSAALFQFKSCSGLDAAALDRRADLELLLGRHAQAERLSHRAAAMRGES